MLFISYEDFCRQAKQMPRLTPEEEKECTAAIARGDPDARARLIKHYLPFVAAVLQKVTPRQHQTLYTVYYAIAALEKGVDTFNFQKYSEGFSRYLSWAMRQCVTRCIAER